MTLAVLPPKLVLDEMSTAVFPRIDCYYLCRCDVAQQAGLTRLDRQGVGPLRGPCRDTEEAEAVKTLVRVGFLGQGVASVSVAEIAASRGQTIPGLPVACVLSLRETFEVQLAYPRTDSEG